MSDWFTPVAHFFFFYIFSFYYKILTLLNKNTIFYIIFIVKIYIIYDNYK